MDLSLPKTRDVIESDSKSRDIQMNGMNGSTVVNKTKNLIDYITIKVELESPDESVEPEKEENTGEPEFITIKCEPLDYVYEEFQKPDVKVKVEVKDTEECDDACFSQNSAPSPDPGVILPDNLNSTISEEEELNRHSTDDGKYMCPFCHKRFANKGNVQRHMILHNKEKILCTICNKEFLKKSNLEKHMLNHPDENHCLKKSQKQRGLGHRKHKCDQCDKRFKTSSHLEQHKRVHLEVKPFQCGVCLRRFAIEAYMVKHQSKSRCKTPVELRCKVCGKEFKKEVLLRSHLRKHTDEKPYTCDICHMSFKYKSTVLRHGQLHKGLRPFMCKYCPKTFTHAGLIKPHMRTHTGEKPYECTVCNKKFTHKHNMNRHMLRHEKVKNLTCEICLKKFPKESRLIYHMKTHTNERPFVCDHCPKRFSHRQNIMRHYVSKHPDFKYTSTDTDASVAKVIANTLKLQKILSNPVTMNNDKPLNMVKKETKKIDKYKNEETSSDSDMSDDIPLERLRLIKQIHVVDIKLERQDVENEEAILPDC